MTYHILGNELVSVIVPTFNNKRTIEMCLRSIVNQTHAQIEIILVDNHSDDGTVEIGQRFGAKILSGDIGMAEARNLGASASSGAYLFNVDSDQELDPRLVQDCVSLCQQGADAVYVHELFVASGFWSRCRMIEYMTYWGDPAMEVPRFVRKKLFERVGGYDVRLTAGEDYDFSFRARKVSTRFAASRYLLNHHEAGSLKYIVFKKYRYGKTMKLYIDKYGMKAFGHFTLIRPAWLRNRRLLLTYPQYSAGMIFIKFLQYAVSFIGLLLGE